MVRVQLVNQHYWPETKSTGQHLTDLAESLVRAGHEVRVLCARPRERDVLLPAREVRNGVQIRRLQVPGGRRLGGYAGFHLAAGPRVLASSWADVTVTLTTPPMLGFWGSLAARLRGVRHVCYLMDHHPDAEFEAGMLLRDSLLGRCLEALYGWTLRSATHNVVLGPYQGERARRRGVSPERISTVPIWSRADETVATDAEVARLRERLSWKGFVLLYSGNAGLVHRFDELLETAATLDRDGDDVTFAFVGGGPRRSEIEAFVAERGLRNVRFHDPVERGELGALLRAADAHFVSLREEQVGVSVPSKLYGQLASERPVLFVGPSRCESAEDLEASGGGRALPIGEPVALTRALRDLVARPAERDAMGRSGRAWFLRHRERVPCCDAWRELLEHLATSSPVGPLEEEPCMSSR